MMTVNQVSKLTGVSIRTLQYYDKIGLLHPAGYSQAGYRLYDDTTLETLQQILLFRELEFPLKDIKEIIESPHFDRNKALEQQIALLTLKKEHLENLIDLARGIKTIGVKNMDFSAFDTQKIDEYAAEAKKAWGTTPEYREYEEKAKGRTEEQQKTINVQMMNIFAEFGKIRRGDPASSEAQGLVKQLQDFITEHFYTCSKEILASLGTMYAGGGEFTVNIDRAGGEGTAEFTKKAIDVYTEK
ncbi:MAG: MerR family transcriptional regulator [Lachnospiraceae bacterium]|nr:MerR family transcriptional regulator [Lachnospiraceae bacterium]